MQILDSIPWPAMPDAFKPYYEAMFSAWFWLPDGVTWEQIESRRQDGMTLPVMSDLKEVAYYALVFAVLRFALESTVFKWLAAVYIAPRPAAMRQKGRESVIEQKNGRGSSHVVKLFVWHIFVCIPQRPPRPSWRFTRHKYGVSFFFCNRTCLTQLVPDLTIAAQSKSKVKVEPGSPFTANLVELANGMKEARIIRYILSR